MSRSTLRVVTLAALLAALAGAWSLHPQAARQASVAQPAAGIDATLLTAFRWRSIGPPRGGRSIAISGVRGRPKEGYFGAAGGGLWKTTDGGENWAAVTDGQIHSSSVGAVAVSETVPDVVFIGMGESCIRGDVMEGDGVYKSVDAGKSWMHVAFPDARVISKIRIHPFNPDVVFVAAFGRLSLPSNERGVYKSTDGGRTWKQTLFKDDRTGAVDIAIDRRNPNVMFAALWEAYRLEYTMSSGGPGSGLYKSIDGGETWTDITRNPGLPKGVDGKIGVSISGADSNRVYAIVENENGGLFVSDDGGATWKSVNEARNIRQRAFYYTHVTADPKNRDIVYVQNVGTFKSTDGGKTMASFAGGDSHDLWIDPDDTGHIMHASDSGGAVTYTGGGQWSARDFPTGQFYHVATTKHVPYHVCGAQQDSSTICVPSDTGLGGRGGRGGGGGPGGRGGAPATYGAGGAEPGYVAPDPKDQDVFFAGGNNGSFMTRINRRTGENREVGVYPRMFSGEPSSALVERVQWTYPIVFSPVNPAVLYTATQHVWKTTNGGQAWAKISGDLTRHDPKTMGDSGGPITHDMNSPEVYATVFALGPGKTDVNVIWAGSDDGLIHVTRDGGKTWTNVTPKEMPDLGRVSIIDASAFDAGGAYVAVKRPLLGDLAPYIFRTHDFGRTWTKIVSGIGPLEYVHAVREDPTRKGLLYAGTQDGFYISYDDGDIWLSLSLNLPDTQISDIAVEENDIAISTHGRGFYILDHVEPLRQYTPAVHSATAHLFKPEAAIRSAGGATIAYLLRQPAQSLTIEVLDAKGQVLRSFAGTTGGGRGAGAGSGRGGGVAAEGRGTGAAAVAAGGAGAPGAAGAPAAAAGAEVPVAAGGAASAAGQGRGGRGGGGAAAAQMTAGLNAVSWDLRYPSATSFPGMILWGGSVNGPAALPGTYQVRMTVDGKTLTQPLVVRKHPLYTGVTDADLKEQFDLAIQIRDKVSEANNAIIRIRNVKSQVADRLAKAASDPKLKAAGDTLTKNLGAVEEEIYQVRNQSGQDPLNFPIKLNNRLATLLSMVNHGDGKPIGNALPVLTDLAAELKVQTDRLLQVLVRDLPVFNAEAKRLGLDAVSDKSPTRP
jgi:photosystem II stability/assembly factor-like uncharacterized protein